MQASEAGRHGVVTEPHVRPYPDPLRVRAGERLFPDQGKKTEIAGWTWCADSHGRAGWVPQAWIRPDRRGWAIARDYDAIELTVDEGEEVHVLLAEAGFLWVTTADGRSGWVPDDHVRLDEI
jgi:hypothetical protein